MRIRPNDFAVLGGVVPVPEQDEAVPEGVLREMTHQEESTGTDLVSVLQLHTLYSEAWKLLK